MNNAILAAKPDFEALGDKFKAELKGTGMVTEARRIELLKELTTIGEKHPAVKKYTDEMRSVIAVHGVRVGMKMLIRMR